MLLDSILFSFLVSTILIVWFQTNAFIEYFGKFPFIKKYVVKYQRSLENNISGNFINFLVINYNSFFVRLISCPYCVTFWLSLPVIFLFHWKYFGLTYILSMLYYRIVVKLSNEHR